MEEKNRNLGFGKLAVRRGGSTRRRSSRDIKASGRQERGWGGPWTLLWCQPLPALTSLHCCKLPLESAPRPSWVLAAL